MQAETSMDTQEDTHCEDAHQRCRGSELLQVAYSSIDCAPSRVGRAAAAGGRQGTTRKTTCSSIASFSHRALCTVAYFFSPRETAIIFDASR